MIFYSKADGTIVASISSPINQGSTGVNEVVLIAPFPTASTVFAAFELPGGIKIYPKHVSAEYEYDYTMARVGAFDGLLPAVNGVALGVWRLTLDRAVTMYPGVLKIQFYIVSATGQVLPTSQSSLPINKGVSYLAPTVTDDDFTVISTYLAAANTAMEAAENSADAAAGSAEASAGSAKAASDSAQASADSAEASAGSARSSAQSADDSENFANAAAASSNAAAKSAEDSESSAEVSEIASKSFYDYIITTEDQFLSLPAYTGRILVKGVHLSQSAGIWLSQGTTLLEFRDCSKVPNLPMTITAPSDKSCTIRNFKLSGGFYHSKIYLQNFGRVENVEKLGSDYLYLENCNHISNSVFDGATDCTYIDNCLLSSDSDAFFSNCKFICGVETNDTLDNIEFLNCSFISNVNASGRYEGCTFVDPTSCKGFISSDDEGKVAKLSGTGEFNTAALPQAVVAEISDDKYILSIRLNDANGNQIGAATTVDLPLEQMIVDVKYDEKNDSLIVELINGKTTVIPLGDIISGLATTLYVDGKANDLNAKIAELAAADKTHADDLAKLNSEYAEKIAELDAKLTIGVVTTEIIDGVLYINGDSVNIVDDVLCYSA